MDKVSKIPEKIVLIGSIGIAVATIPELYNIIKTPKKVKSHSSAFLLMKLLFTILVLVGLSMSTTTNGYKRIFLWLFVWYTIYYSILMFYYINN